jgi:hypothetical protein
MNSYSTRVVLHDVVDAFGWPSSVGHIAHLMGRPLPAYLAAGPYPSVSARTSGLLHEIRSSILLRTVTQDDSNPCHSRPLTDVFDIVLSSVSELRDLIQQNDFGCPRPTVPLWSSLIRVLGRACSEDASVMCVHFAFHPDIPL